MQTKASPVDTRHPSAHAHLHQWRAADMTSAQSIQAPQDPTTSSETLAMVDLESSAPPAISSPADLPTRHTSDKLDRASHQADDKEEPPDETDPKSRPVDVEHVVVENDPREWSRHRKSVVLA